MDFVLKILNLQITLFLLIGVGFLGAKIKLIKPEGRKCLSDILINIVLPCNTISAFLGGVNWSGEFARDCFLSILISAAIQLAATFLSPLVFRKLPAERRNVCTYGMICSNSSFIGLPVAEALFGSMGVLFTSIFQIPIRFTMWTAGLSLFTSVNRKDAFKKLLVHPCIIAIFVGFILIFLPWKVPEFAANPIRILSRCTTPLSMLVIGSILSGAKIKSLFSKDIFLFTFIRIILFPLIVFAALKPFELNPLILSISVIMSGMPAGSTASILADKYGADALFASQIIFVSTLFSILTIPLLGVIN